MKRFTWGLFLGTFSTVTTWALSHHALLSVAVGLAVAFVIWFWHTADMIGDLIGDAVEAFLK